MANVIFFIYHLLQSKKQQKKGNIHEKSLKDFRFINHNIEFF